MSKFHGVNVSVCKIFGLVDVHFFVRVDVPHNKAMISNRKLQNFLNSCADFPHTNPIARHPTANKVSVMKGKHSVEPGNTRAKHVKPVFKMAERNVLFIFPSLSPVLGSNLAFGNLHFFAGETH